MVSYWTQSAALDSSDLFLSHPYTITNTAFKHYTHIYPLVNTYKKTWDNRWCLTDSEIPLPLHLNHSNTGGSLHPSSSIINNNNEDSEKDKKDNKDNKDNNANVFTGKNPETGEEYVNV